MKMSLIILGLALAALAMGPRPLAGQRGRTQVEEGNRLYSEGRFDEAHQKYLEGLLADPESPLIRFNDGNALYQSEDFQKAMERFLEAAESGDPALQNAAWYNLGNALYKQQQLQESLEAYKQALRANPSDPDAKHNLERVLEQLQEQEQDQNQQGEGGEPPPEQNQENQEAGNQQDPQNQESQEDQPSQEEDQGNPEQQEGEATPEDEPQQDQGQPEPQPGEMTPEEAQSLLNAIREDPGEVNRKRAPTTGKRPRKDW